MPRKPRSSKMVAERISKELAELPERVMAEGAVPLNPGAFLLERIRAQSVAKRKLHVRAQVKGK